MGDLFNEFILYKDANDDVKIDVYIQDETLWLTQKAISQLFDVDRSVITKHLKNIFETKELDKDSTCAKNAHVASNGKKYNMMFYNLDVIIAIGYRVNSRKATMFRIWATKILKEYIIKGFAMNDERLKNPEYTFGKDYFEEQLNRIRDIRSSERRFYQKITDIYAKCSADYDPKSELTLNFYKTVQNKLHYAITGKTAAEIIQERVDSNKPNMGLTSWKNGPKGRVRQDDITIAKNYLDEKEIDDLNRIVSMYLDYAELQAEKKIIMYMKDWIEKLNAFLNFNELNILDDAGKTTHSEAENKAKGEYKKYIVNEDKHYISDFDAFIEDYYKSKMYS